jgi:hypothetical protein
VKHPGCCDCITYLSTDNNYWYYDAHRKFNELIKSDVLCAVHIGTAFYSQFEYKVCYYVYDCLKKFYSCNIKTTPQIFQQFYNDKIIDTCQKLVLMRSGRVIKHDYINDTWIELDHCKNKKIIAMTFIYDHDMRSIMYLLQSCEELILLNSINNTVTTYDNCAIELQRNRFFTTKKALT